MIKTHFIAAALAVGTLTAQAAGVEGPTIIPVYDVDAGIDSGQMYVTPRGTVVGTSQHNPPMIASCRDFIRQQPADMTGVGKDMESTTNLSLLKTMESAVNAFKFANDRCRLSPVPASAAEHDRFTAILDKVVASINVARAKLSLTPTR